MGLDMTHECWHGAYSAFSRWRNKLAEVAGYTFCKTGEPLIYDTPQIDWGCVEDVIGADLFGEWPAIPVRPNGIPDPLIILIAHQDCEGRLQHKFLAALADRLEELLPLLANEGDGGGHIGSYQEKTKVFIAGLREAASKGEDVEFH